MHPAVAEAVKQLQTSYADYQPLMDEYGITPRIVGVTVSPEIMVCGEEFICVRVSRAFFHMVK